MNKKENVQKKEYLTPDFIIKHISFNDCLSASQPGGGAWGYFDEDPTEPTSDPYDDFWD